MINTNVFFNVGTPGTPPGTPPWCTTFLVPRLFSLKKVKTRRTGRGAQTTAWAMSVVDMLLWLSLTVAHGSVSTM